MKKKGFVITRIVGDGRGEVIDTVDNLQEALNIADENAYDEEPDESVDVDSDEFSWADYEVCCKITHEDVDCVIYWIDGGGDCDTDLSEGIDPYYDEVMEHINSK